MCFREVILFCLEKKRICFSIQNWRTKMRLLVSSWVLIGWETYLLTGHMLISYRSSVTAQNQWLRLWKHFLQILVCFCSEIRRLDQSLAIWKYSCKVFQRLRIGPWLKRSVKQWGKNCSYSLILIAAHTESVKTAHLFFVTQLWLAKEKKRHYFTEFYIIMLWRA